MTVWLKEEFKILQRFIGLERLRLRKLTGKVSRDLAWSRTTGKSVCLGCGYRGEDIQGTRANLWQGYGCPQCHSALVVRFIDQKNQPKDQCTTQNFVQETLP